MLQAVLTHRGRSSSSGHYVAWVRQKGDMWLKCDDDQVSPVTSEEVLKLSGGGKCRACAFFFCFCVFFCQEDLEVKHDEIE
jgi:ubiquitin carboxyl-terminal hydrolase 14